MNPAPKNAETEFDSIMNRLDTIGSQQSETIFQIELALNRLNVIPPEPESKQDSRGGIESAIPPPETVINKLQQKLVGLDSLTERLIKVNSILQQTV